MHMEKVVSEEGEKLDVIDIKDDVKDILGKKVDVEASPKENPLVNITSPTKPKIVLGKEQEFLEPRPSNVSTNEAVALQSSSVSV